MKTSRTDLDLFLHLYISCPPALLISDAGSPGMNMIIDDCLGFIIGTNVNIIDCFCHISAGRWDRSVVLEFDLKRRY